MRCGIYLTNKQIEEVELKKRLKKINFRGPDYLGFKKIKNLSGHLRLSILDLDKRSNQPMVINGNLIVYNGEIYNYIELKEELKKMD